MPATEIDASAVVDPSARIGEGVRIGPYCIIGSDVEIGDGCALEAHVVIRGPAVLGRDNRVAPMTVLGGLAQRTGETGAGARIEIGSRNDIREFVTVHRGSRAGSGVTRLGDDNMLMAYTHIGHDCAIGNGVILVNAATLAGHVEVADGATIGAHSGVHQFCRVGREAFIGGYSVVTQDALPWVTTVGNRATTHGLNVVGLRRKGYPAETIRALKRCYMTLFRSKLKLEEALSRVEREWGRVDEVRYFVDFVRASRRGVVR